MSGSLRLWRVDEGDVSVVAGSTPTHVPRRTADGGLRAGDRSTTIAPVPSADGYFVEIDTATGAADKLDVLGSLLGRLLAAERDTLGVAEELAGRYEEIDLLYTISEILGRTIRLEEAAEIIVREVSSVVGARRASIFVHDAGSSQLTPVSGWGIDVGEFGPIAVDDEQSIAAQAFRECRSIGGAAGEYDLYSRPPRRQKYRGTAFLSVPIIYPDSDGRPRPVGVINLTDRLGADAFSSGHRKLVEAIAHQIGAAIENARLVSLDRQRQRVRRELELAHDLQLRLLPKPAVLADRADVAARCSPGELVGGDFFQFVPLPGRQAGVMLGDVATHGYPAALIMALVLSAAGIHAAAADSPETALKRLLASVRSELTTTEMFLTLFYGMVDPVRGRLRYANAGHQHAFIIPVEGSPIRLEATAPPLGLDEDERLEGADISFTNGSDLLVLFSDGIAEALNSDGDRFGEQRVLEIVSSNRDLSTEEIVEAVFADVTRYSPVAGDDQTLLVLRT